MNKYKVVVYAISLNEEKFVDRWYESMKEADEIYVLDTGSTDNTVDKLKAHGVHVIVEIIKPWRFDVARNISLNHVPLDTDICVCTDLDEVIVPGWRKILEDNWNDANRFKYIYNWALDEYDRPKVSFISEKIHDRIHYKWIYPVHEVLECNLDNEKISVCEELVINHYPDHLKPRSSYLNLLKLSVKENPDNDRNMHYLGREYMYHKEYKKAISTLKKHIKLESATWDLEKCASMRFIGRCYKYLGNIDNSIKWYKKAIHLCPNTREPYTELGILYYEQENYFEAMSYLMKAKTILENKKLYINEVFCWDSTIDDLLSICFYNLDMLDESLLYANKALEYDVNNQRIINNIKYINNKRDIG